MFEKIHTRLEDPEKTKTATDDAPGQQKAAGPNHDPLAAFALPSVPEHMNCSAALRVLTEQIPAVLWAMDRDLVFTWSVGKGLEKQGFTPNEVLGWPLSRYLQTGDPNHEVIQHHRRALAGEQVNFVATFGQLKYQIYLEPNLDPRGEIAGVVGIALDTSESIATQDALKRREQQFRSILKHAPDYICQVDTEGRVQFINRIATGRRLEEVIGKPIADFNHPEYRTIVNDAIAQVVETGGTTSFESVAPNFDGADRTYVSRLGPVWQGDEVVAVMIISSDVTEARLAQLQRVKLEARLLQRQKMESIGTLASGVAHEINNPIQGIMNYAELIAVRAGQASEQAEFARKIVAETERVAAIVKNLLAFSRDAREEHSPARITDIIESTLSLIRAAMRRDQITIEVDLADDMPLVKCRSQQIQQVLMNLLTNARDALNNRYEGYHEDKRILVKARRFEARGIEWVSLTVEDHGEGIPEEIVGRVFDPFFTTKRADRGTGLGLSVSHGIVTEHHGRFEVESEVGSFTRFTVELRVDNGWSLDREQPEETPPAPASL